MALLTAPERAALSAELQQAMSEARHECGVTRVQFRAGLDAIDQWIEDNTASFLAALPVAFRNNTSARVKSRCFAAIVRRRFELGG